MRFLYITTIGSTMVFFNALIEKLVSKGNTVDIATNDSQYKVPEIYKQYGCKVYHISCSRIPVDRGNLKAIKQIKDIVNSGSYDVVHCHTPIAAMCTRLACRTMRKKGVKVLYTAHGFHFYKGAPLINWLMYYPIEKICSYFTDVLITINNEDFLLAKHKFKSKCVLHINGVGIDTEKYVYNNSLRNRIRMENEIPIGATLFISVGELNENKNHEIVIKAISSIEDVYYFIIGTGNKERYLKELITSLGLTKRVKLIGFRSNVADYYSAADVYVFPSYREGLSVALMEAMSCGLPVACSRIRGNIDLVKKGGGLMFDPYDINECTEVLRAINKGDLKAMGDYNRERIKEFDIKEINKKVIEIYDNIRVGIIQKEKE